MATVIDSLLVKLGLDAKDFHAGQQKVDKGLKNTGKEAESAGKKVAQFLAILGGTYAVKRFTEDMIESTAALDRFSKNLGESASTVTQWSNAAEVAGGTAEGLKGTIDMLSRSQTELQLTGQSGVLPYFAALGVALAEVNGKARPTEAILLDLSDRFKGMDQRTAYNLGRMMGIDPGTMNLLLKGRQEVTAMLAKQKEYGDLMKKLAPEGSKLREEVVKSKQAYQLFAAELFSRAVPALEWLFSVLSKAGEWMRANKETVETFLTIMAVGLGAVAASTIPINLTVAAVTGLAAAIALLWQDYQTWKKGGDSLIDWAKWEPGIKAAGDGIKWLKDLLGDFFYRAAAGVDMLAAVWNKDWKRAKFAAGELTNGNGKTYGGSDAPAAASGGVTPQGFFESKGWSKAQAAGIVANLQSESGMKAGAVGDNGAAYGIAQWHPDRQAAFKKWSGRDIKGSSLDEQLAFVHYELTEGSEKRAGAALRGAITAERAGEVVSRMYERPGDADGEASKRGRLARSMFLGIPGASQLAAGASASQVAEARAAASQGAGSRTVETNIGEVKVYTAATDAKGIAADMKGELDSLYTAQADYGPY